MSQRRLLVVPRLPIEDLLEHLTHAGAQERAVLDLGVMIPAPDSGCLARIEILLSGIKLVERVRIHVHARIVASGRGAVNSRIGWGASRSARRWRGP